MGNVIDLSLTYHDQIPGYSMEVAKTMEKDGWNASNYHFYSHCGTHMDAPVHFGEQGTLDQFDVNRFVCNCHLVHLTDIEPRALIEVKDLGSILDKFSPGEGLLFHTNWSHYVSQPDIWRDQLPRISKSLAQWMVEKQVNLIGVEPPSVADVNNLPEVTEIHKILLAANIFIVEGLTKLEELKSDYVQIIALPLKVLHGDGAPARVIAIEQNQSQ